MCYCAFACTTWRMCGAVRECNLSIVNYCSKPSSAVAFYRSIWHVFTLLSLGNANAAAPQDGTKSEDTVFSYLKPINGHIKTAKQRTTIGAYSNTVIGTPAVDGWGVTFWYSEEGPRRSCSPTTPLLVVPNVTAHPSTAGVPTSYYSMWHYAS